MKPRRSNSGASASTASAVAREGHTIRSARAAAVRQRDSSSEVWAPWNLEGFVWASSHTDWRGKDTRSAVADTEGNLDLLFRYEADPFRETQARLAFAFATYGLDRDPVGFARFLAAVQDAYAVPDEYGKRIDPAPEQYEAWLEAHMGPDFGAAFRAWWEKPPSWKSKPKPLQREE